MKKALIHRLAAQGFSPPERPTPSEWAVKEFRLSKEASAEPGHFSFDRAPYQRGILDALALPTTKQVVLMLSSQTGKTTMELVTLGYFVVNDPCPILWVCPSLQEAERTSKTRISPMIRDCPSLKTKFGKQRERDSGNTLLMKSFPGGQLIMSGSNSPSSLSSYPIRMVIFDEVDRCDGSAGDEGDFVDLAVTRTLRFWNSLIFMASTPAIKGESRIEKAYLQSNQQEFWVKCPHCGEPQNLTWEGIKYTGKGTDSFDTSDLLYFCRHCGAGIPESAKYDMISGGKWTAQSDGQPGIVGFGGLNELYAPGSQWRDLAMGYQAAYQDQLRLQVFVNTRLGLPYEPEGKIEFDWENLMVRAGSSQYSSGHIPADVLYMTSGVDVQGDRLECSIFGWAENEQCFLISHTQLWGNPIEDAVWQSLEELLTQQYQHPLGGKIRVGRAFVDSSYLAHDVYAQTKRRSRLNWIPIKGREGDRPLLSTPKKVDINWRGQTMRNGVTYFMVGIDAIKQTLLTRCKIETPGKNYLNVPQDLTDFWAKGFAGSEVQVAKFTNGRRRWVWEKVYGVFNEPLDCAVYAYAAACQSGITRFNWDKRRSALTVGETIHDDSPIANDAPPIPDTSKLTARPRRQRPHRNSFIHGR
jgi:phage terminase large subunit GpA-like protein